MVDVAPQERRQHTRQAVGAVARLAHADGRDFPCLCADASPGGARLLVPAAMPVRVGRAVRLIDPAGRVGQLAGLASNPLPATIVRVDRRTLLTDGAITVGVHFQPAGTGRPV